MSALTAVATEQPASTLRQRQSSSKRQSQEQSQTRSEATARRVRCVNRSAPNRKRTNVLRINRRIRRKTRRTNRGTRSVLKASGIPRQIHANHAGKACALTECHRKERPNTDGRVRRGTDQTQNGGEFPTLKTPDTEYHSTPPCRRPSVQRCTATVTVLKEYVSARKSKPGAAEGRSNERRKSEHSGKRRNGEARKNSRFRNCSEKWDIPPWTARQAPLTSVVASAMVAGVHGTCEVCCSDNRRTRLRIGPIRKRGETDESSDESSAKNATNQPTDHSERWRNFPL